MRAPKTKIAPPVAAAHSPARAICTPHSPITNDVWWPGVAGPGAAPPRHLVTWLKRDWYAAAPGASVDETAHANSRFTAPATNCPSLAAEWQQPEGVPVDAIVFGGRRSETVPLVAQSHSWAHGVLQGATLSSEQTAAAEGRAGDVRFDPMAMRPFIGYDTGRYFARECPAP